MTVASPALGGAWWRRIDWRAAVLSARRRGTDLLLRPDIGATLICTVAYLWLGLHLMLNLGIFAGDAISRTANGMNVVTGRDPHAAAIGFVWNPLPSLVQIPLIIVLDRFGLVYVAAPLMSTAFSAATLVMLDRILHMQGMDTRLRWAVLLLYGLNPLTLFYGATGLSEAPFFFTVLGTTYFLLRWCRQPRPQPMLIAGLFAGAAFLVRYEALAFAPACTAAILLRLYGEPRVEPRRVEANLIAFLLPFVYAVSLWVWFNFQFMGDPLFFVRSDYGNLAQTEQFRTQETSLSGVVGSPIASALYATERWLLAFPAAALFALALVGRFLWRRDPVALGTLLIGLSIPVFHIYQLYAGMSFGWLRFYMYSLPFAFVFLAMVGDWRRLRGWLAGVALTLVIALGLGSGVSSYLVMTRPEYGREEAAISRYVVEGDAEVPESFRFATEREIARYIDSLPENTLVLMDSFLGFPVNVFSRNHHRFVITSDRDFVTINSAPWDYPVTHILVLQNECPQGAACLARADQVAAVHGSLWAGRANWASLERDFGGFNGWRLYRITGRPES